MHKHGFTLIELLLVVLIAGLVVGMAVPRFVESYKGARLRNSVRTVVRLHRFARSESVLNQQEGALLFDLQAGTVTLISIPKEEEVSGFLDEDIEDSIFDDPSEEMPEQAAETVEIEKRVERSLEQDVKIRDFECEVEGQEIDGIHWVGYFPNGMCDPYSLRLFDPDGERSALIEIDSVSGKVGVQYE